MNDTQIEKDLTNLLALGLPWDNENSRIYGLGRGFGKDKPPECKTCIKSGLLMPFTLMATAGQTLAAIRGGALPISLILGEDGDLFPDVIEIGLGTRLIQAGLSPIELMHPSTSKLTARLADLMKTLGKKYEQIVIQTPVIATCLGNTQKIKGGCHRLAIKEGSPASLQVIPICRRSGDIIQALSAITTQASGFKSLSTWLDSYP